MSSRIEKLEDGFFVTYLDIGNLPKAKGEEICKEFLDRYKEQKKDGERMLVIPVRNQEPQPIVHFIEREVKRDTFFETTLLVLSILVFVAILV